MTVDLGRIDWVTLGAIATFLLALGTVWLGWQTRIVSRETGELAKTTAEEIELSRQQAKAATAQAAASGEQAKTARDQFEASQRQRKEDARPLLHWTLAEYRFEPTPGQNLHAIRVIGNARNHGAIGLVSNLEIQATVAEVHQPMTLHSHPVPPGGDLELAIRFGPIRSDIDFAFSAKWSVDAKGPNWGEILTPTAELECRVFDHGQQLVCELTSQLSPAV